MSYSEIENVAEYIANQETGLNREAYAKQLHILYGAIYEAGLSTESSFQEIVSVEQERFRASGVGIDSKINSPKALILEYSKIAFLLAKRSLEENKPSALAKGLKTVYNEFLSSSVVSEGDKKELKMMISETGLDFSYASGNQKIASMRMAPLIRDTRRRSK